LRHGKEFGLAPRGTRATPFRDNEQTFEELLARVARTIDYLKGVPASALEGSEDRDIKVPARDRTLQFKGLDFLQRFALPNFFFHVTTAYDILRHNGVELGKRDFTADSRIFRGARGFSVLQAIRKSSRRRARAPQLRLAPARRI